MRFIIILIVFFAGFAAGIYCAVPVVDSEVELGYGEKISFPDSMLKSDEFAQSFNVQIHKYLEIVKDVGLWTSEFVRQKFDEEPDSG